MTTTETHDVQATIAQIGRAGVEAGCEVVRVAVPKSADVDALGRTSDLARSR